MLTVVLVKSAKLTNLPRPNGTNVELVVDDLKVLASLTALSICSLNFAFSK